MSSHDGPEYLDLGSGRPMDAPPDGRRRTALVVGGAIGAAALIGAGAWAAWSFLATGPQPAEALPASTIAYASIDLDPSGGQKIAALQTLKKFPAFEDEIGLDTDDDIRKWIFDEVQGEDVCPDLDYADDVEPWLGDRFAAAAIDTGGEFPDPVFVVQVTDEDAAETGLTALFECSGEEEGAWTIADGWAVVAETQDLADQVAADAADAPLAEDDDFTHWTDEAGDPGIATLYIAPGAGELLADYVDSFTNLGGLDPFSGGEVSSGSDVCAAPCTSYSSMTAAGSDVTDELTEQLENFQGAAATLRFDDGSLELEFAGSAGVAGPAGSGAAGDMVGSLPEDTAVAIGVGFTRGWIGDLLDDELLPMLEDQTGLDLPDDAETLAGEAAALVVGGDFDPEAFFDSADGSGIPVGLKVRGDADAIEDVLDRLRADGGESPVLASDSDGDLVAIGPDADYRELLLEDGGLGDSEVFRDAVPDADDAAAIVFVSFDAGEWLDHLAESDPEVAENLRPLAGLGVSARFDGDTSHLVLRVTTD